MTSSDIDIFLKGVRAEFAMVEDQAATQSRALDTSIYLNAESKLGPLFTELNGQGKQRFDFSATTGVGEPEPTGEVQAFPETQYYPTYITSAQPSRFAKRIRVSLQSVSRRDPVYSQKLEESAKLVIAAKNKTARIRFQLINETRTAQGSLTTGEFGYGDAQKLLSTIHADKNGGNGVNVLTPSNAISDATLESIIQLGYNTKDDVGEPMPMLGGTKYLITHINNIKKTKELIESEWKADTANNNINVWRGQGWILVTSPFITSTTAVYVVDALFSPLVDITFKPYSPETWYDQNVKAFVHDIEFEKMVGPRDWRGFYGTLGDGSAITD